MQRSAPLSRVPDTDGKTLATALALGIIIDATIVRGLLAPALVAALGDANWWLPGRWGGKRPDVPFVRESLLALRPRPGGRVE